MFDDGDDDDDDVYDVGHIRTLGKVSYSYVLLFSWYLVFELLKELSVFIYNCSTI